VVLLVAFAAGIWGTLLRPAPYEITGTFLDRPASNMILIRHEAAQPLGMGAMELMAVFGEPGQLDAVPLSRGDRVRLAVRRRDGDLVLVRVEKLP
jgi:hypothetical protein